MRKRTRWLLAGWIAALASGACSEGRDRDGRPTTEISTGSIGLNLVVGGLKLSSVSMTITNAALLTSPITRTINVSSSQARVSAFVGGVPAGVGYRVRLTATAAGGISCDSGQVTFEVLGNATVAVTVPLTCGTGLAPQRGSVAVQGSIASVPNCPYLSKVSVAPLQVELGQVIDASALANLVDGATYEWTATAGAFADSSSSATTYTCTAVGAQTLSVVVSRSGCPGDRIEMVVNCLGLADPICTACQQSACSAFSAARDDRCAESNSVGTPYGPLCVAYENCVRATNCANTLIDADGYPDPRYCYCGLVDADTCFAATATPTTPEGPCRDEFAMLAGASLQPATATPKPSVVASRFYDIETPMGAEGYKLACTQANCDVSGYCQFSSVCGNGVVESGEQCDPPVAGICNSRCLISQSGSGGSAGTGGTPGTGGVTGGVSTCRDCQQRYCPGPLAARDNLCTSSNSVGIPYGPLCDQYERCVARTNCANVALDTNGVFDPRYCYCGPVDSDTCFAAPEAAAGPCREQFAALAAASVGRTPDDTLPPLVVSAIFFDLATPFGAEGQVLACTQNRCDVRGHCSD